MSRAEALKIYDALVERCDRFDRKGKTMPYTSANGYMFSLLSKDDEIGMRFSKEVQERYIDELQTGYFMSYGAIMKGYITIPETMYADADKLEALLNDSYDYVMSLKPK